MAANGRARVDYTAKDIWDSGTSRTRPRHTTTNCSRRSVSRKRLPEARRRAASMHRLPPRACPFTRMADSHSSSRFRSQKGCEVHRSSRPSNPVLRSATMARARCPEAFPRACYRRRRVQRATWTSGVQRGIAAFHRRRSIVTLHSSGIIHRPAYRGRAALAVQAAHRCFPIMSQQRVRLKARVTEKGKVSRLVAALSERSRTNHSRPRTWPTFPWKTQTLERATTRRLCDSCTLKTRLPRPAWNLPPITILQLTPGPRA